MNKPFLIKMFDSHYCKVVFALSVALMWFISPKRIFYKYYAILGWTFIITSSLVLTCFIRNIKERVVTARSQGSSLLGILLIAIGLVAMNVCTVGAPICGASVAVGILSLILPGVAMGFFEKYAVAIIASSIALQLVALYYMKCFKKVLSL